MDEQADRLGIVGFRTVKRHPLGAECRHRRPRVQLADQPSPESGSGYKAFRAKARAG